MGHLRPTELIFQCHTFLPFHTVHVFLKARILKWFAIPFSSGPCFVKPACIHIYIHTIYTNIYCMNTHTHTHTHTHTVHVILQARILENSYTFPSPGDLPNPGIKPRSPALQADSLSAEPQGKPE